MENFADDCTIVFSFFSFFSILIGVIGISLLFPLGILTTFFQDLLIKLNISEFFFMIGLFWLVGLIFLLFYASIFLPYKHLRIGKYIILGAILLLFFSRWFFIDNIVVYILWIVYFLLSLCLGFTILWFIPHIIIGTFSIKQKPQNPIELNELTSDHDAIIVVDYINQLKFPIYGGGIDILINYFFNKRPYKIYQISNPDEFKKIVFNSCAKNLWIFGHGARDRLSFGAGIEVLYNDLKNAPKKNFVAQLHCNNCIDTNCNPSLADLIANHGCVTNTYRKLIFYRRDTRLCLEKYYNCQAGPIFDIFNDLKDDREKDGKTINLINKSCKLILDNKIDNASGDKAKNEIKFNLDYFQDVLSKNDGSNLIRFILLHEEAHISNSKSKVQKIFPYFGGIVVLIALIIVFFPINVHLVIQDKTYVISNFLFALIVPIVFLMIGIPAIWRYQWDIMYDDEIFADHYAVECLIQFFNDPDLLKTLSTFFTNDILIREERKIVWKKIIMKLVGAYPDYHPPNSERLARIKQAFHGLK